MAQLRWRNPILLACRSTGQYSIVTSTAEALNMLVRNWPVREGPALRHALDTAEAAVAGGNSHENARDAFICAAGEADVSIVGCLPSVEWAFRRSA